MNESENRIDYSKLSINQIRELSNNGDDVASALLIPPIYSALIDKLAYAFTLTSPEIQEVGNLRRDTFSKCTKLDWNYLTGLVPSFKENMNSNNFSTFHNQLSNHLYGEVFCKESERKYYNKLDEISKLIFSFNNLYNISPLEFRVVLEMMHYNGDVFLRELDKMNRK